MNLAELKVILEATGFPVAYSHFTQTEETPVPDPPYLVYLVVYSSNFNADNKVYQRMDQVQIELYTSKKDMAAEEKVEAVLNEFELPFGTTETFVESEELYQKIYEVRLIYNARK